MARPQTEGELLRKTLMKRLGITQEELARQWGCSQPMVSQLLSNQVRSPEHRQLFAAMVGMPQDTLFPPDEDPLTTRGGRGAKVAAGTPAAPALRARGGRFAGRSGRGRSGRGR